MSEPQSFFERSENGKLAQTSGEFRKFFLLAFTKELIKHSKEDFFALEHQIKKEIKDRKNLETKEEVDKEYEKFIPSIMYSKPIPRQFRETSGLPPQIFTNIKKTIKPLPIPMQVMPTPQPVRRPPQPIRRYTPVVIPEYPLPPTVQYLKPYPTNAQIDLGKLNPLIQDPAVKVIECNSPDENLIVKGNMGTKPTSITLSKDEINEVFRRFSEASRIPVQEGISKIVVGRLILSAIVSEVIGSKFIIRKMENQMPSYGFGGLMPPARRGFY